MTAPRYVQPRDPELRKAERCALDWRKAEEEYARGCVDCGKSWELHFHKGTWKGCGV